MTILSCCGDGTSLGKGWSVLHWLHTISPMNHDMLWGHLCRQYSVIQTAAWIILLFVYLFNILLSGVLAIEDPKKRDSLNVCPVLKRLDEDNLQTWSECNYPTSRITHETFIFWFISGIIFRVALVIYIYTCGNFSNFITIIIDAQWGSLSYGHWSMWITDLPPESQSQATVFESSTSTDPNELVFTHHAVGMKGRPKHFFGPRL